MSNGCNGLVMLALRSFAIAVLGALPLTFSTTSGAASFLDGTKLRRATSTRTPRPIYSYHRAAAS